MSFSPAVFGEELNSQEALNYINDASYQAKQQLRICREKYKDDKTSRLCFRQSLSAYESFYSYKVNLTGIDETMDMCLEASLKEFWIPSKNTAYWSEVLTRAWKCYEHFSDKE